jgi:membrane-associated phospholipid phosphatase
MPQIFVMPVPTTRTFPITFTNSGDVVYPDWAYPYRGWTIPSWLSGLISIGLPILVYIFATLRIKSAWDLSAAIMGTIWSVLLATLFQVTIKQLIGGFRPTFLDTCRPDLNKLLSNATKPNPLNGSGYQDLFYTVDVCTQTDKWQLKHAMTSFPSGHSTAAFAGFGFLFLWLNAKLKVWADHRPAFWKLTVSLLPLLGALLIACSLTIDAAHNWYDIVAGSAIGILTSLAAYRASYAAIWDWRYNHLALQGREAFLYSADPEDDELYKGQTITRAVGWGGRREWLGESSGVYSSTTGMRSGRRGTSTQEGDSSSPTTPEAGHETV